jgi:predicted DNA-binding transcriptional regulator AlpA
MHQDSLEDLRVISEPEAIRLVGVSRPTWSRMRQRGEAPPKVQISRHRIGYRIRDLRLWIEARTGSSATSAAREPIKRWQRSAPAVPAE